MNRLLSTYVSLLLIVFCSPASSQEAQAPVSQDQLRIDAAIARVYPSLARIHVVAEQPRGGRMEKAAGTGSGTIIHEDGYIVTNHHVAGNATRVWVRLSNKERIDAKVVGTDPQTGSLHHPAGHGASAGFYETSAGCGVR